MASELELNVDFDLSLRPRGSSPQAGEQSTQVAEMAWHALFACGIGDSVRVQGGVPEEFLDGLHRNGMNVPELTIRPAVSCRRRFTPFGWSRSAIELNRRYDDPTPHPEWSVVCRVNSRVFSRDLERDLTGEVYPAVELSSLDELEAVLAGSPELSDGWVVKANHGNSGLGNRRIRSRRLGERERGWVRRMLADEDRLVLEPWRRRVVDLGVSFELTGGGAVGDLELHEVVNTADGAFIGAIYQPVTTVAEPWLDELESTADEVAGRLHREGYFGSVNLDAFVWQQDGEHRLRPLVDLNARSNMSREARRLWESWQRPAVFYWRFFTRSRLRLPGDSRELDRALGDDRFDPGRRRGTLVTSPLWVDGRGGRRPLHKLGVLFAADSRDGVLEQEMRFRRRFDR